MNGTENCDFDIAICGAGPAGMALAALLCKRGVAPARIALIDARPLEQAIEDPRSIAVSWGSRQILDEAGAWPVAANDIRQIHVSRRGHFGRTLIDCTEFHLPALGYVTRYGALVKALGAACAPLGLAQLRPARIAGFDETAAAVSIRLEGRAPITARIVVQAEGGVFADQGARAQRRDYEQTAIIAKVLCSAPVPHRAFERFTDEGPLALLPQEDGYALVWCAQPASVQVLMEMEDTVFLQALSQAFGERLGRFTAISARHAYPLGLNAGTVDSARMTAIGNAAQTLHPVAGQGLNLGLRDVAVLAALLAQEATPAALQHYASSRAADRRLTIGLTDTLARIFTIATAGRFSQSLLGLSLALVDGIGPAKRLLAGHMMYGHRA